jgi:hypothetical protein
MGSANASCASDALTSRLQCITSLFSRGKRWAACVVKSGRMDTSMGTVLYIHNATAPKNHTFTNEKVLVVQVFIAQTAIKFIAYIKLQTVL